MSVYHFVSLRLTSNQTNVAVLVLFPLQLRNRALNLELIANLKLMEVLAHLAIGVLLNDEVNVSLSVLIGGRGVWANDISGRTILLGNGVASNNARGDMKTTGGVSGQVETEKASVMVDFLDFLELKCNIISSY